jgi:hypothetical protein
MPDTSVDMDGLPPTQYLILDVLAARWRTGEHLWTFPTMPGIVRAAHDLGRLGLVGVKSGVEPKTILVWLTDTSQSAVLSGDYVPPLQRREPVRVVVVTDWRRQRVYSITADDDQARQDVRDVAAKYGNDPLSATMTVWLVDPGQERRP